MNTHPQRKPIVIMGAGLAGMATALALLKAGHQVVVYERYHSSRPAGSLLNLWPPPVKALEDMRVDISDLGSPCASSFRSASGTLRAAVNLKTLTERYGGGFLGLLRPDLYARMHAAIPEGTIKFNRQLSSIEGHNDHVTLRFGDGEVVETPVLIGCDGIDSIVRKEIWGNTPKRPHNLHVLGGYTFDTSLKVPQNEAWWVLEAFDDKPGRESPVDILAHGRKMGQGFEHIPELIAATPPNQTQRWVIRDRQPINKWSKGRVTLAGDAAHPTSPYAEYGAGMSICDGYCLGQSLAGVDLTDTLAVVRALEKYEQCRIPHTTDQVNQAYFLGQLFHHSSWYMRPIRDMILDWTPFLQWSVGDRNPTEIMKQLDEMGNGILSPKK